MFGTLSLINDLQSDSIALRVFLLTAPLAFIQFHYFIVSTCENLYKEASGVIIFQ
jgi:hypothetical protein